MREENIEGSLHTVYGYTLSQVLHTEESSEVTFITERSMKEICTLHRSMRMDLEDLESACTVGVRAKSKRNTKLNCLVIITS